MVEMTLAEQMPISMELQSKTISVRDTSVEDALITKTVTHYKNDRVKEVGTSAFQAASKLVLADLPETTKLAGYVFNNCAMLSAVNVPKVTFVGNGVFANCAALATIEMPSLTQLYSGAFSGCTRLTKVILPGSVIPTLYGPAFSNTPIAGGTGHIYVPDGLVDSYKRATNWSAYANQFKPISEWEG